ncbi:hypothetical protein VHEMI05902 [[Torrubiella] hemipterigena]|uniref:Basic proline-rich protein n=1 Tax=[Torrubiella] hemipterigena TaxID=1531966 RepID=A0A0A1TJW9_9HYPO|nr:hypothetical protein VHEMI05902 [[Torrubiella] hemipterigena]
MAPTNKVLLASALALASTASAVAPEHPRIYYPHKVKRTGEQAPERRQFGNTGFNLADFFGQANRGGVSPAQAPPSRFQQPDNSNNNHGQDSTNQGGLGGILGGIFGGNDDDDVVTTVVISKTVTVPPKGTGSQQPTVVSPTKKPTSKASQPPQSTDKNTNTGITVGTSSVDVPVSSPTPSSTKPGGIIATLTSLLGNDPKSSSTPGASQETSTPAGTSTSSGTSSVIATDTVSSSSKLIPLPTSIISIPTSSSIVTISTPPDNTTISTLPPPPSSSTAVITTGSQPPPTSSSIVTVPTSSVVTSSSTVPDNNSTIVSVPTTSQTKVVPTTTPIGGDNSTSVVVPTSQPVSSQVPVVSSTPTPTSSAPATWIPTTMVMAPSTMSSFIAPSSGTSSETKSALPTDVPKNIVPPSGDDSNKPPPKGTVAIQIGFLFQLNYNFVSTNADAAAQIFNYLPPALAGVAGISADKVPVTKLVPFDTRRDLGYITTLAKVNWPESQLDALKNALWEPSSALYNNEQGIVRSLTAIINPKIPLLATGDDNGSSGNGGVSGTGAGGSSSGGGDPFQSSGDGSSNDNSKQKATTIGIAVGSLGIGVMYGAAMFIVARRYKRKRSLRRANAANDAASAEMQYTDNGSPALMGGALVSAQNTSYGGVSSHNGPVISSQTSTGGRSNPSDARSAGISHPVATENSLGWS